MSEKVRKNVTVDPFIATYMEREHVNASGLVNKLLSQYVKGGGGRDANMMLQLRKEQLESRRDTLSSQLESVEDDLEHVYDRLDEHQQSREDLLDEAATNLKPTELHSQNRYVQNYLTDFPDMDSEEFIAAVEERQ